MKIPKTPVLLLLVALWAPVISASQVANLNISRELASEYGCGPSCYHDFEASLEIDAGLYGSAFDEGFYSTTSNFSLSSPGDVLKFEPINATLLRNIPYGTTAYKFQYTTRDLNGTKTPATGFIAFPYANRTGGQLYHPVAYAHGTSGVFPGCAPSAMPSLYDYDSWSLLVRRGYAVVAPDYAGLGNNYTSHAYMASTAQANDIYYAMAAARKLFGPHMTSDWLGIGHSEGGGAVWALAESSLVREDPFGAGEYLGTVAQAPAVRLRDMALQIGNSSQGGGNGSSSSSWQPPIEEEEISRGLLAEFAYVVLGLASAAPSLPQDWIQPLFRQRLELAIQAQACLDSMQALVGGFTSLDQIVDLENPGFLTAMDMAQRLTSAGDRRSNQPMLVVQGLDDTSVSPQAVEKAYAAACRLGNEVHLQRYPGIDHDPVIAAAEPDFLSWVDARFSRVRTSGECSEMTVIPFDKENMYS